VGTSQATNLGFFKRRQLIAWINGQVCLLVIDQMNHVNKFGFAILQILEE
jgi:hypothetical protein